MGGEKSQRSQNYAKGETKTTLAYLYSPQIKTMHNTQEETNLDIQPHVFPVKLKRNTAGAPRSNGKVY